MPDGYVGQDEDGTHIYKCLECGTTHEGRHDCPVYRQSQSPQEDRAAKDRRDCGLKSRLDYFFVGVLVGGFVIGVIAKCSGW